MLINRIVRVFVSLLIRKLSPRPTRFDIYLIQNEINTETKYLEKLLKSLYFGETTRSPS